MSFSPEATDPRFAAELLILRIHEEQKNGNLRGAQVLLAEAIELVGEDEVELIAKECVVNLPDEEFVLSQVRAEYVALARSAWH
jgi:hypothetical protein